MKTRKSELDVDYIGGQVPLTVAEEKALFDYFKKLKLIVKKASITRKSKKSKLTKVIA